MQYLIKFLQIGLAVGDIKAIYDIANFEKQALQVKHMYAHFKCIYSGYNL